MKRLGDLIILFLFALGAANACADTHVHAQIALGTSKTPYLLGSGGGLNWDPNTAIRGMETSTHSGVWTFTLPDTAENQRVSVAQAKIVISDASSANGPLTWMSGPNLALSLHQDTDLGQVHFDFPAGEVSLQTVSVRGLSPTKQIRVYTPPGMDWNSTRSYLTVYGLDGQNLFNTGTETLGTWNLNTTLDELIGRGEVTPMVVVGIDADADRTNEYSYVADPSRPDEPGGGGEIFAKETLPDIVNWTEKTSGLPVKKTIASRTILGSSLGGLEAMYAGLTSGGTLFSNILSLSGSYWWKDEDLPNRLPELIRASHWPKVFFSMGTTESTNPADQAQAMHGARSMDTALKNQGFMDSKNLNYVEIPGASHNEQSWSVRMWDLLPEVFPPTATSAATVNRNR